MIKINHSLIIQFLLDKTQVSVSGVAKIIEFVTLNLLIFTPTNALKYPRWTNFITNSSSVGMAGLVMPTFVPNPNIALVIEEFTTMAGGNWAKQSATETRLGVD